MIPGSNLLNLALSVIAPQQFQYYAFVSRALQKIGQYIATYAAPVGLRGSVQPVPRQLYQQYGLDFTKNYFVFYVSQSAIDIERDVSGDLMNFAGNTYQCVQKTDWFVQDGWIGIICAQIQNIPLVGVLVPPAPQQYNTGDHLVFTLEYNEAVVVTGTPFIVLMALAGIISSNAVYVSGSGTNVLMFSYTVVLADTATGIAAASPVNGNITSQNNAMIPANSSFIVPNLAGIALNHA